MGGAYIIRGGEAGRARLSVLSQVMAETTDALFDRIGVPQGGAILDAGCGPGDVTRELAYRAGPGAQVVGVDLDEAKLSAARAGNPALRFERRAVDRPQSLDDLGPFDLVYARFLLSHLADPAAAIAAFRRVLKPGGLLVIEDCEFAAHLCWPPRASFDRYVNWYRKAARKRGADPDIGPKLPGLLRAAGLRDVEARVVQPGGLIGPAKQMAHLTLDAITPSLIESGIASPDAITADLTDLRTAAADPTVLMTVPRVTQAWARQPS